MTMKADSGRIGLLFPAGADVDAATLAAIVRGHSLAAGTQRDRI